MNLNRATLLILLCLVSLPYRCLEGMDTPPLMPLFKPSPAAQKLIDWACLRVENPQLLALDKEKTELYLSVLQFKDYPKTMDIEVRDKVLMHLDVVEAVLLSSTEARYYSRNDYITVFFLAAARAGNISALTFFIERGVKINEVKYGFSNQNAMDWAMERGQEETVRFLLGHGAKLSLKANENID